MGGKKDRSLFLFSDLIICTTLKRKSGSLRRSSMSLYVQMSKDLPCCDCPKRPPGFAERRSAFRFFRINARRVFCLSPLRYSAASAIDTSSKYKFLWKLPLEDVEVVKSKARWLQRRRRRVDFSEILTDFFWNLFPSRLYPGDEQGEHPEDDRPIRRGSQHAGPDQQTVRDPQLPSPGCFSFTS